MILITGAAGFVGRRLVHRLAGDAGLQVRVLLRPGGDTSRLPRSVPLHTMIGDITDPDSLVAALNGIHTVYHLIGTDMRGRHARLDEVDVASTKALVEAARAARVGRVIIVSRIGADRASAFPMLKAKGEIEEIIRQSGLAYTIFRSSVLFGRGDHFSEHIAMMNRAFPVYFVPGEGATIFQPLWVEDLVSCLAMALENLDLIDATLHIGGPELLSYRRIVMRVMHACGSKRPIVGLPLLVHQAGAWFLDGLFARWPINQQWIEMFAAGQTAELGSIERNFHFRPSTFDIGLIDQYMQRRRYSLELARYMFTTAW
jgi:NADH dehydrogenase